MTTIPRGGLGRGLLQPPKILEGVEPSVSLVIVEPVHYNPALRQHQNPNPLGWDVIMSHFCQVRCGILLGVVGRGRVVNRLVVGGGRLMVGGGRSVVGSGLMVGGSRGMIPET